MKILLGSLLLLFALNTALWGQMKADTTECGWRDLAPAQFKKLLADSVVTLIDVRTSAEYHAGHIEGARNIDVRKPDFDKQITGLKVDRPVAVYCKGGVRSRVAARKLVQKGFRVYNLDKGYLSWPDKLKK